MLCPTLLICYQTQSGTFATTLNNLANSDLPPAPPAFAAVVATIEQIEGVRFAVLFERLPRTAPDGDAAIAAVWKLATEEKRRCAEREKKQDAVLASLPESVRAAFELEGEEFSAALKAALAELPEEEADAVLQQLRDADLIGGSTGPDMEKVLTEYGPLLEGIAAAVTNTDLRSQIEEMLPKLEENGWELTDAVHRIWAGERDAAALTAGIDGNSAQMVNHILESIEQKENQAAVLASLPESVRAAFDVEGDAFGAALAAALAELPEEEAEAIMQRLRDADLIGGAESAAEEQSSNEFDALLQAIAAAATDASLRGEIEPVLADLQEKGWMLPDPVHRIWAGERDPEVLTAGLDEQDAALVRRILELAQRSEKQAAVLASLPESVRAAFDVEGDAFGATLAAALAELPEEEAGAILQRLRDADLIGGAEDTGEEEGLEEFGPLLREIASAVSDESLRSEIEPVLADLQGKGWMLVDPVHRIWAGERNAAALTAGLDEQDAALVRRILEMIGMEAADAAAA
jgi:hypothetical protein